MSVQASQFGDELRVVKGEVAEVNRLISRLQSEIEAVKAQVQVQHFPHVQRNSDPVLTVSGPISAPVWRTSWLKQRSAERWR